MKLRHFSIRDLLWLFVVVALATGWGLDRVRLEQARRNELAERQRALVAARQAQYAADVSRASMALQQSELGAANRILQDDVQYFAPGPETLEERPDAGQVDAAELRTWTRGDFTLEARFVRLDGANVILRKGDGAEVSVPLKELSAVDQSVVTMAGPAGDDVRNP
jgi:hypothetical protein